MESVEDNGPDSFNSAEEIAQEMNLLERYASEIRQLEKKLSLNDDLVVEAAAPEPWNNQYRAELKALIVEYAK